MRWKSLSISSARLDNRADNGLISGTTLGSVTTEESQNHVGEPWKTTAKYGGTTLWEATYARDSLGRITGITETIGGVTRQFGYGYSVTAPASADSGFLSLVTVNGTVTERYAYDANGNRLRFESDSVVTDTATASYDDQDRLLCYGATTFTYTAAGEVASATTGGNTSQYTYDPLGNLTKVQFQNGDPINYLIDGRNRRVGRKFNGTLTARWLYQDQLEPVAEIDASGAIIARYVYGTRAHVPDYVVKGDTTYRIISDHLGSVRLVVNASTGVVAQRMDYDGYGRVTVDTSPGFQAFGYAGGLYDTLTALVRFGARDYDAEVGRWTSKDPIGFGGGANYANLYTYVGNHPVNLMDPSGLAAKPWICRLLDANAIKVGISGLLSYSVRQSSATGLSTSFASASVAVELDLSTGRLFLVYSAGTMEGIGLFGGIGVDLSAGQSGAEGPFAMTASTAVVGLGPSVGASLEGDKARITGASLALKGGGGAGAASAAGTQVGNRIQLYP